MGCIGSGGGPTSKCCCGSARGLSGDVPRSDLDGGSDPGGCEGNTGRFKDGPGGFKGDLDGWFEDGPGGFKRELDGRKGDPSGCREAG